jgi:hypothetical protein
MKNENKPYVRVAGQPVEKMLTQVSVERETSASRGRFTALSWSAMLL